jgi:hypothetical protein
LGTFKICMDTELAQAGDSDGGFISRHGVCFHLSFYLSNTRAADQAKAMAVLV